MRAGGLAVPQRRLLKLSNKEIFPRKPFSELIARGYTL